MKFKTVRDGQQAAILNHRGEARVVVGPQRVFLFRERFSRLEPITAGRDEYVEIREKTGEIIHKPGPCQVFNNTLEYDSCRKVKAQRIDANHLLVVYKRLKGGNAERRIIQGPAVFMPGSEEWAHEFRWHGSDPKNKARMVPGLDTFTQLPTIPSNFYYNVSEVRTSDDSMITVKLMLFYEMLDILKMLHTTHDPIADLINAVCADVISFVGPLTYLQFIDKTSCLSDMATYPQLQQRAERMGFHVQKVVFRGYHASEQLQEMQNNAIESRTRLRLERELEDRKLELTQFKLNEEQQRSKIKQEMELKVEAHRQELERIKQEHALAQQELASKQQLELSSLEGEAQLELQVAEASHKVNHLESLKGIGVDLNSFVSLELNPRPQEEIRVLSLKK